MFAGSFNANPGFECMTDGCENERSENEQVCPDFKNGLIASNMEREPIGLTPSNSPGNAIQHAHHGGAAMVVGAIGLLQRVPEYASMRLPPHLRHPDFRNMNQDRSGAYCNPNQGAPAYHGTSRRACADTAQLNIEMPWLEPANDPPPAPLDKPEHTKEDPLPLKGLDDACHASKLDKAREFIRAYQEQKLDKAVTGVLIREFDRLAHPDVIQGGTGTAAVRSALKAQLSERGYSKRCNNWKVYLLGKMNDEWDGRAFGHNVVSRDIHEFRSTNIHCVAALPDPGRGEQAWGEEQLMGFYNLVACVKSDKDNGYKTVVACVAGRNRSVAVKYAIEPEAPKPVCEAMCRAAEGFRNNRNMDILPLAPRAAKRQRGQ